MSATPGTPFSLLARPRLPAALKRLDELAGNLVYSWDRELRGLFRRLDDALYAQCGNNPKLFLMRVAQEKLERAATDRGFLAAFNRVLAGVDAYHAQAMPCELGLDPQRDLIAYFCFEFGFHESVPLYSGGLGILAGDHCKAASDLALPFVALGLLYRQGYFVQTIDHEGQQHAHYQPTDFDALPFRPARVRGQELHVTAPIGDEQVLLRVWEGRAGHARMLLLDSDIPQNPEYLRTLTYQLYGGDSVTRIRQEIALGIGGVRALQALGLRPTVWHMNEGHPAFLLLERCGNVTRHGWSLNEALELAAANTVFTTHTPVPAGHDVFPEQLVEQHLGPYLREVGIGVDALLALGRSPQHGNGGRDGFNMTTFALAGSRHHNGVSAVHGGVASENEHDAWPEVPAVENPISFVTNGVHLQTFLALEWVSLFDVRLGDWRNEVANTAFWEQIDDIPDHQFFSLRQDLKAQLMADVRRRLRLQHQRNGIAQATTARCTEWIEEGDRDVLLIGFARRFATYKRATLIFSDRERLRKMLCDPQRPVVLIMAGKAHPHDLPGQALLKELHAISMSPEFMGHVILLENYDLAMARALVAGVDVWLNTPEYPLEASGTSGMKAGINGSVNLSVLDGWWAEGFDGENGFGIVPHGRHDPNRDREEAQDLLDILERRVIPLYFNRDHPHFSSAWIKLAKRSMKTLIPRFNSVRMVREYVRGSYVPARDHGRRLGANDGELARGLAAWRARVLACWPGVALRRLDSPRADILQGDAVLIEVAVQMNGLTADDVRLECVVARELDALPKDYARFPFHFAGELGAGEALFRLEFRPPYAGVQHYRVRLYPVHTGMAHPLELGRMRWL